MVIKLEMLVSNTVVSFEEVAVVGNCLIYCPCAEEVDSSEVDEAAVWYYLQVGGLKLQSLMN